MEQQPLGTVGTPQSSRLMPAVVASVLISALVAGGGVYAYQKRQADSQQADLQAQIDDLKLRVRDSEIAQATPTPTPTEQTAATPASDMASWKTYTDSKTGLSFKYPADLALNNQPSTKNSGLDFSISVHEINKIPDAPLWYGPEAAKEEMAALAKGDTSKTRGAEKLLSLGNGTVGATAMNLMALSCDSVMFNREAHIYRNNYQILIRLDHLSVDALKANNPSYFGTSKECLGDSSTEKIWSKPEQFHSDVASGKTDAESQRWYTTLDKILSTVTFK